MHIFFHHIRSWLVGEGQERREGGNATWEVVSVSKSKLLGDILQHNHPLCLCSAAHMAHIQPVTVNHCYFLTSINKNKPYFRCSMWGKKLRIPTQKARSGVKNNCFCKKRFWEEEDKKSREDLTNGTNTCCLWSGLQKRKNPDCKKLCPGADTASAALTKPTRPDLLESLNFIKQKKLSKGFRWIVRKEIWKTKYRSRETQPDRIVAASRTQAHSKASTQTKFFYTSPSKFATNGQLGRVSADLWMRSNVDAGSFPITFCSQPFQLCSAPSAAHTPKSPFPALS